METRENRETIELDLKRILLAIWQRLWIILLTGVLLAGLAYGYAWMFVTPTYEANTQIYVNNQMSGDIGFSSSQISAAQELAYTYMVILESRSVLDEVAKRSNLGYTAEQIKGMLDSKAMNRTEVFQVTVTNTNYKHAAIIANAIADVLPDKIAAVVDGSSVRVVDRAVENPNPVGPNYQMFALVGLVVGCAISALVVVIVDLSDTTVTTEDYLSHVYSEYPLLALIPGAGSTKNGYRKYRGYYKGNYESAQKKAPPRKPELKNGGAK